MSDNGHHISVTLKGGNEFSSPWIVVYGDDPAEVSEKLKNLGDLVEQTVITANLLKGANNAAPLAPGGAEAAAPAAAPPAQKSWGQAPAAPAGGTPPPSHPNAQTHPAGETCDLGGCGKLLEFKKTQSGKSTWRCPDWRWANGNPNGHRQEWAD